MTVQETSMPERLRSCPVEELFDYVVQQFVEFADKGGWCVVGTHVQCKVKALHYCSRVQTQNPTSSLQPSDRAFKTLQPWPTCHSSNLASMGVQHL